MDDLASSASPLQNIAIKPVAALRRLGLISIVSFLIGTIVPGIVSYSAGVFYETQIQKTMQNKLPQFPEFARNRERYEEFNAVVKRYDQILADTSVDASKNIADLVKVRDYYSAEASKAARQSSTFPFFLSPIMLLWTGVYTSFGCLVFILSPAVNDADRKYSYRQTLTVVAAPFMLYECPVWFRNFVLSNEGRRVYSFANRDIAILPFVMQEFNSIFAFLLLAAFWKQWLNYLVACRRMVAMETGTLSIESAERLTSMFVHWQAASAILALGFICFTSGFWDLIVLRNDQRYILPALVIHCVWAISWLLISLPLAVTWHAWRRARQHALTTLFGSVDNDSEVKLKLLQEITPIPPWNAVASGIAAVFSFVFPIFKPFLG